MGKRKKVLLIIVAMILVMLTFGAWADTVNLYSSSLPNGIDSVEPMKKQRSWTIKTNTRDDNGGYIYRDEDHLQPYIFKNGSTIYGGTKASTSTDYLSVETIGGVRGKVAYCMDPNKHVHGANEGPDGTYSRNVDSETSAYTWNISSGFNPLRDDPQKTFIIGLILTNGYIGNADLTHWTVDIFENYYSTREEYFSSYAQFIATRLLVWEVMVGERDLTDFSHQPPSGNGRSSAGPVYGVLTNNYGIISDDNGNPNGNSVIKDKIKENYDEIVKKIQLSLKIPSFMEKTQSSAPGYSMQWNGSEYKLVLEDTNGVLDNFVITASPTGKLTIKKENNTLILTSTNPFSGNVQVQAVRDLTRKKLDVIYRFSETDNSAQRLVTTQTGDTTETVTAFANVSVPTGTIKIVKSSDDGVIKGVSFTVKDSANKTVATVTTGSDGTVTVPDLPEGTYTVTETTVSTKTKPQENSLSVAVKTGQTATVSFNNIFRVGNLKIVKSSTDGVLSGFEFRVESEANGISKTVKTESDGTVTVKNLPIGAYTVTEVARAGYIPNPAKIDTTVVEDATVTVTFSNAAVGSIKIMKASDDGVIKDVSFDVKDGKGTTVATVKTNTDGIAVVGNLPIGTYTITETTVSKKTKPQTNDLSATVTTGSTAEVNFKNVLRVGDLKIVKASTDEVLSGFNFLIESKANGISETLTTGPDGTVTRRDLPIGDYTITELDRNGYIPETPVASITVEEGMLLVVNFKNAAIGNLKIIKVSETKKVSGISFTITNSSGVIVETVQTGVDGTVTVKDLPIGEYVVREAKAPSGTMPKQGKIPVTIVTGETVEITFYNVRVPKTGDDNPLLLYAILAMLSLTGIVAGTAVRKRSV